MAFERKHRARYRALRLAAAALILPLAAGLAAPAMAQSGAALHAGTLEVPVNKSQVVSTDRPIARAMIGNDKIADVLPVTDRSIYVLGKLKGTTSLTLYDAAGRVISVMDVAVGPDVDALNAQMRELIPGETILARISNESVVLSGTVNSAGAADRAFQLAKAFADDKVINLIGMGSSQQVMLEVRFAEVNRSAGKDIGVSAFSSGNSFGSATGRGAQLVPGKDSVITTNVGGTSVTSTVPGNPLLQLSAITGAFGIFRKSFSLGGLDIEAVLDALETRGLSKTLAQPTLVALSGERASFLAGGEFPVPVAQSGSGAANGSTAITVEFKPFGVSLGFTPTVLGDKTISMIVEPEVSAIDPTASITIGNITIPGLRTRRASTTIELRDGESFAIAGLLARDFQTTVDQVPLLGSIPILGALFRSSSFKKGETELLIVVTPRLVAPIRPSQVQLPTDRVKDPTEAATILLGQPYNPQKLPPVVPGASPPVSNAPSPPSSAPRAAAELPAKGGDYAF